MKVSLVGRIISSDVARGRRRFLAKVLCEESRQEPEMVVGPSIIYNAAPGPDDVGVQMMLAEPLFEIWLSLFEVCWEYGMVPSMWNESLVHGTSSEEAD